MVINYLNAARSIQCPLETDAVLIVNTGAVLSHKLAGPVDNVR